MMKEREYYMFCSDCGCAFKAEEIFRKAYANTAICLCQECALKLAREIMDKMWHAKWIKREGEYGIQELTCSNCGKTWRGALGSNYCEECGAKMDGIVDWNECCPLIPREGNE